METKSNGGARLIKRHIPTLDEIVSNSVANMAIEGFCLNVQEVVLVRARAHAEFTDRLKACAAAKNHVWRPG